MKADRQQAILRIISEHSVSTQEELARLLREAGFVTTQATVSRDIRELRLAKEHVGAGRQRYVRKERRSRQGASQASLGSVFSSGITGVMGSGNLIVVKTHSGMAMAVGTAIDSMDIEGVLGCIAGDDTIFVAIEDVSAIDRITEILRGVTE